MLSVLWSTGAVKCASFRTWVRIFGGYRSDNDKDKEKTTTLRRRRRIRKTTIIIIRRRRTTMSRRRRRKRRTTTKKLRFYTASNVVLWLHACTAVIFTLGPASRPSASHHELTYINCTGRYMGSVKTLENNTYSTKIVPVWSQCSSLTIIWNIFWQHPLQVWYPNTSLLPERCNICHYAFKVISKNTNISFQWNTFFQD